MIHLNMHQEAPIWWSHGLIHTLQQNMIFLQALGSWHMCEVNQICGFRYSNVNKKNHATFPILTLVFTVISPNSKTSKKFDHPTYAMQAEGFVIIMFKFSH
jgi:hypothetical protein